MPLRVLHLLILAVTTKAFLTPVLHGTESTVLASHRSSRRPLALCLRGGASAPQSQTCNNVALPATFRALRGDTVGSSFRDVAKLKELPLEEPGEGKVLVEVKYAGINGGCETFRVRGEEGFQGNKESNEGFSLGAEGAGIVRRVGSGVENVQVGDQVLFVGGAFAEFTTVDAATVLKVKEISKEIVGLRISATTGWGAVHSGGQAKKRQVVLVTAGAGAAGSFAVQFAKQAGCEVVATTSSQEKAVALCKLGCDHIINYKTRDVNEVLKRKFPGGVDLVIEHVGGKMLETAIDNCKKGGKVIIVGYISQYPHNSESDRDGILLDLSKLMWKREVVEHNGVIISGRIYESMDDVRKAGPQVVDLYESGQLKSLVDAREFKGLESIPDAVEHMLSGKTIGKVVVDI